MPEPPRIIQMKPYPTSRLHLSTMHSLHQCNLKNTSKSRFHFYILRSLWDIQTRLNGGTLVTSYRLLSLRQKVVPRNSVYIRQKPSGNGKSLTHIYSQHKTARPASNPPISLRYVPFHQSSKINYYLIASHLEANFFV
jgi:hypothetical protein